MEKITGIGDLAHRVWNRIYLDSARLWFTTRAKFAGGQCWVHGGPVVFPYVGDGDMQALHYSKHGQEWWDKELTIVSRFVPAGAVAIDVGANIGFLTALFSKLAAESGRVFSLSLRQRYLEN